MNLAGYRICALSGGLKICCWMVGLGGHGTQWYQFWRMDTGDQLIKVRDFYLFVFFSLKSPYYHSNSIHNCTSIQSWAQVDQSWIVPVQSIHMELSACKRKVQLKVSTAYLDLSGNPIRWWVIEKEGKRWKEICPSFSSSG